jgi:hypothetical protein
MITVSKWHSWSERPTKMGRYLVRFNEGVNPYRILRWTEKHWIDNDGHEYRIDWWTELEFQPEIQP